MKRRFDHFSASKIVEVGIPLLGILLINLPEDPQRIFLEPNATMQAENFSSGSDACFPIEDASMSLFGEWVQVNDVFDADFDKVTFFDADNSQDLVLAGPR